MIPLRRLFLLTPFLLLPACAAAEVGEPPLKVLFLGNSYTSVNDLPALVAALAEAGGRKIEADYYLPGGYTFAQHARDAKALEKIRANKWDVVVLQEQSLMPVLDRASMHEHARKLHEEIAKQGAKTVFYLTWARQDIPQMQEGADPATSPGYAEAMYRFIGNKQAGFEAWCQQNHAGLTGGLNGAYLDLADELHAGVAPVGMAWQKSLAADPKRVLHQSDKSHPNPQGSYLAACVFYATLFDKSPVGLPGELKQGNRVLGRLTSEEAAKLQEIAWQTVEAIKRRHPAKAGR